VPPGPDGSQAIFIGIVGYYWLGCYFSGARVLSHMLVFPKLNSNFIALVTKTPTTLTVDQF